VSLARLTAALADRYRIERELGAGGMATVYLAEDLKHKRKVALKVLKPELAAVLGAERFIQEITTTAALQHPHILPLFDSGTANGFLYYVMPFIDGETLRSKLDRETQLGIDEAVRITTDVASALHYAHTHGVIHRDIKPENILLHDGRPMVADFGIALAVSAAAGGRMTETGLSLGTPHYMSPEQATAEKEITARSDVYSLGSVLYEMLTGNPPHTGASAQQIIMKIVTEEAAPVTRLRKSVPPNVAAAVAKSLEKLPADRFESAKAFGDALVNPGFSTAMHAADRERDARGWRFRRPHAIAGLVVMAALIAAAFLFGRSRSTVSSFDHVAFDQRTFATQSVFAARFTRDGETIVYSAAAEGSNPAIYIIRPDNPTPSQVGNPGTQLLAVSSRDELAVLVHPAYLGFRLFNGTLARMPLVGGAPRELLTDVREADWSPDGSELAIIHEVNGKDRLEFPIGKVLFESTGYLSDVRVAPGGDRIAFLEHPVKYDDRGMVGMVDLQGRHQVLTEEYWGLQGLAWSVDGKQVLFAGAADAGFYQIHSTTLGGRDRLILPSAGSLTMHDMARSGRWLITRDDRIVRLFVKPPAEETERDFSWLDQSGSAALSNDGSLTTFINSSRDAGSTYATMVRRMDGTPAVRLGAGYPTAISSDKRWVLSIVPTIPPQLMLYPVGPGKTRRLDSGELTSYTDALLFPGDSTVLVCGTKPDHAARCYVRSLAAATLRAVTPEGTQPGASIAPDGRRILARTDSGYFYFALDGSAPVPVPSLSAKDEVVRWSPDGRSLWITEDANIPLVVKQLDLATGRRQPLMSIQPATRAGVVSLSGLTLADDPRTYTYSAVEYVNRLFVVSGMK
jgi:serine/threonine protein kinase